MEDYKKNNLVDVFPDPLILTQSNSADYLESVLNLHNLTNDYIIFRIFNNQRSLYSAKPSTSFIKPMETTKITIKRFNKEKKIQSEQGKDKFLLLFYTINKIINNNDEVKEAFKTNQYNDNSKQETIISIIIKDDLNNEILEKDYTYNENDINEIGDDYIKGIKVYDDLNENLRKESNKINERIKEMEKIIQLAKQQKQLKIEKDLALKDISLNKKTKGENYNNIILISILLLGLLFGANVAKGYNKAFNKKNIPNNENRIYNKTVNYIINKTVPNETKIDDIKINNEIKDNIKDRNETINLDIGNNNNKTNKFELNKTNIGKNETINLEIPDNKSETINLKKDDDKNSIELGNIKVQDNKKEMKQETKQENKQKNKQENKQQEENKKDKNKIVNKKPNNDFLSFSFLSGIYLCLLEFLI